MDPTTTQIDLLREVIDGKKIFAPKSDSLDDMNLFQVEAEELIELGDRNLLTGCRPKRESYTGKQQIVRVLVAGVTAEGRRLVQSLAATKPRDDAGSVTCPNCNHSLRASARFCDDCGFALQSVLDSTLPMSLPLPSTPSDSFVGVVLQGKYEIISEIGRGGMGRVYRARHRRLGKEVAIKVIDKKFVSDPNFVERFLREARAAASLKHTNIIDILDIDETPEPDPRPYIVMEFVDGKSLKEIIGDEEKLKIDRTVALFVEICKAVSFAHQHGVIHRDLKPDNIMIIRGNTESGEKIKVLDFGLAKMRESDDQSAITQVGTVMGTPPYMSPEQCRGEELDARSDVYSLATILFEMISGAPPFSGSNVYSKHQFEAVPAFDPSLDIPMEIVEVVNRGLAKNREDRPDAQEFSQALKTAYAQVSESRTLTPREAAIEEQNTTADQPSHNVPTTINSPVQMDSAVVEPLIEPWLNPPDHVARIDWYDLRVRVHNTGELILRDFDVEVTIPKGHTHPNDSSVLLQQDSQGDLRYYRLRDKPEPVFPGRTSPILMMLTMMVPWDEYSSPTAESISVSVYAYDRCVGKKQFLIDDLLKPDRRDYIRSNRL